MRLLPGQRSTPYCATLKSPRCGAHDADEDPDEPDYRIGEVSPIIGKGLERPVVCTP
jgi:hypothetical protein